MIRTKFSTKNSFKYASTLARCSPFVINLDNAQSTFRKNRYGGVGITVMELMPERTEVTFLTLVKMAGGEVGKVIECSLKDIARQRGVSENNLSNPKVLGPLCQDIKLLLKTGVRINMDGELKGKRGLIFNDTLIHGGIKKDDSVRFDISQHLVKVIKDSKQGYFYVQYQIYSKLRSPIARRLYLFFVGQSRIRAGMEYEICLEKLCGHIGYLVNDPEDWAIVRGRLKQPLKSLQGIILKKSKYDISRHKSDGGVLVTQGQKADKPTKQLKATDKRQASTKYREVIDKVKDALFEKYDTKHLWNEGALVKQLETLEKYLKPTLKRSFSDFVGTYCLWLTGMLSTDHHPRSVDLNKLFYSTKLFDENNSMFKQFMDGWEKEEKVKAEVDYYFKELSEREMTESEYCGNHS